ncbi:MAG: hypothetical protein WCQ44_01970 [Opitutaceae bacterium]
MNKDFSPKPVFKALDQLINYDWKIMIDAKSSIDVAVAFRGFGGEYSVAVKADGKTTTRIFSLKKGEKNEWIMKF